MRLTGGREDRVTQEDETEPVFRKKYWDHHDVGLYGDVVSGQPSFSPIQKFESSSGWDRLGACHAPCESHRDVGRSVLSPRDPSGAARSLAPVSFPQAGRELPGGPNPRGSRTPAFRLPRPRVGFFVPVNS